jgi:hypothetical protein
MEGHLVKDAEVYEALGGKVRKELQNSSDESSIRSIQDKSLVDEQGECDNWDREVTFQTDSGEGKVNSFYPGEYDEYVNSLVASAAIALACTIKNKQDKKR